MCNMKEVTEDWEENMQPKAPNKPVKVRNKTLWQQYDKSAIEL